MASMTRKQESYIRALCAKLQRPAPPYGFEHMTRAEASDYVKELLRRVEQFRRGRTEWTSEARLLPWFGLDASTHDVLFAHREPEHGRFNRAGRLAKMPGRLRWEHGQRRPQGCEDACRGSCDGR